VPPRNLSAPEAVRKEDAFRQTHHREACSKRCQIASKKTASSLAPTNAIAASRRSITTSGTVKRVSRARQSVPICYPPRTAQRRLLPFGRTVISGRKHFFPVKPASCLSFLILLGRTKVRLRPLLLELYPSSSDELVNDAILGAALRGTPSRLPIR
jgi:hypothetical protein